MKKYIQNLIVLGSLAIFVMSPVSAFAQSYANNAIVSSPTSVILNASINPNGSNTSGWFEYGTDANLYTWTETPHIYVGSNYGEMPFTQTITNLAPNTIYYYRAVANSSTTVKGSILSFVTNTNNAYTNTNVSNTSYGANAYNTNYTSSTYTNTNYNDGINITNITATGAILNAVFTNPHRSGAQGYFEWGPTKTFGNMTEMMPLGTNYTEPFSGVLTNLTPNTTYYFRAIVVQNGQTYRGGTRSFQTYSSTVSNPVINQNPTVTTNQSQIFNNNPVVNPQIMTPSVTTTNSNTLLEANAMFGANFLPNNIFGWILLLLIILAIVWAFRKISQTTYVKQVNH